MPRINCPVCGISRHCTIVSSHRTEYHSQHGTDWVTKASVRLHKHRRKDGLCAGSYETIHVRSLEDAEGQKQYLFTPD